MFRQKVIKKKASDFRYYTTTMDEEGIILKIRKLLNKHGVKNIMDHSQEENGEIYRYIIFSTKEIPEGSNKPLHKSYMVRISKCYYMKKDKQVFLPNVGARIVLSILENMFSMKDDVNGLDILLLAARVVYKDNGSPSTLGEEYENIIDPSRMLPPNIPR